jgi:glutathionylspermidine synthase
VLGSPFNLSRAPGGRVALFDTPCDVLVRHYKTDWWSEREPARDDDEPFTDNEPLAAQLGLVIDAELAGRVAVMNPFGAVVIQNKRTMALLWEAIDRFSPESQAAIRAFLPYTVRLESLLPSTVAARADWVLKSDYGCEGAEVIIGADVDDAIWADALAHARRGRWIAQRHFAAHRDADGRCANVGVYVVGGEASGFFSRVHRGATDYHATTVATLVEREVTRG